MNESVVPVARHLLSSLDLIPITTSIVEQASLVGSPNLRSLDAIHLASALMLGPDLQTLVAYDQRLKDAAEAEGLAVAAPS